MTKKSYTKNKGEYVRNPNPPINRLVPGKTQKAWKEDNKEHVYKVYKEYYNLVDKKTESERVACECGRVLSRGCLNRHKK